MESLSSLVEQFIGKKPTIKFSLKDTTEGRAIIINISRCPVTGTLIKFRKRTLLTGRTVNTVFNALWAEMIKILELENNDHLKRMQIIVRHSLIEKEGLCR